MHEEQRNEGERRERKRVDGEPIVWRDIARREDRDTLPFLHFFDVGTPTTTAD
jgi:hypothetical protein